MASAVTGFDEPGLLARFNERFGSADNCQHFFSPGRVNLIGDHTDYNGGLVFPCAIDYGSKLLFRKSDDDTFKFASTNFDLLAILSKAQTHKKYGDHWINYPLGVLQQFDKDNHSYGGFECLYSGDVPNAAGLSSSASIEVVTAYAINQVFNCGVDLLTLIKMAQRAENEFVGVQCGIMDQFAVAMGRQDHAMQLDCQTLECLQVPMNTGDHRIVLVNTNQRRELSESKYNERVTETREAVALLNKQTPITQLAELTPQQLEAHKSLFVDHPVLYARARHVVTENDRVKRAVQSLTQGDLITFGQLMIESHHSLRDDYKVSSEPLDVLVDLAVNSEGVLGARLTGAGFGGCTVNLVHKNKLDIFCTLTAHRYHEKTGLSADFYRITPSQGVREIS